MHDSSVKLFQEFRDKYLTKDKRLLVADIGCYDEAETYKRELQDHDYVGIDCRPGKNVQLVTDEWYRWENVPKLHYDVAISGQTLEHIPEPWYWIWSVYKILRPGGLVWICAPNTWEFHEVPQDCWRVWPDGMRALLEHAGFEVLEADKRGPDTWGVGRKT